MRIEHVALYVSDLERAREFFVRYFGGSSNALYHNEKTGFRSYFISFSDGARLELMTKRDLVLQDKALHLAGYAHLAFSLGSKEKVHALTEQLRAEGCEVISGPRTTGDGYYESCILDFEGNRIELTV